MRILLAFFLLCPITVPLAAQTAPRYATAGPDTLRYRETTLDISTLDTPNGIITQQIVHEAMIRLRFLGATSAEAWYETLRLSATGPQGDREPSTAALLGQKYTLGHDGRGHLTLVQAPTMPAAVDSLTDLRRQFDDFLIVLPDAPLFPGFEWSDSTGRTFSPTEGSRVTLTVRRTFRVVRDSLTLHGPAWVIASSADLALESSAPTPGKLLRIVAKQTGAESGIDLWHRTEGRMIGRTRTGQLQGKVTVEGGTEPIEFPQLRRFESSIILADPR